MDINVTLTVPQAMQLQAALADRVANLTSARCTPGTLEADIVSGALRDANDTLLALVAALYPDEPVEPDWRMPESVDPVTCAKAWADRSTVWTPGELTEAYGK